MWFQKSDTWPCADVLTSLASIPDGRGYERSATFGSLQLPNSDGSPGRLPFDVHGCVALDGISIRTLKARRGLLTIDSMAKAKKPETGEGYLGESMVHRISGAMGVVDSVLEAKFGWPPEITLKLKDGSLKKGKLSDFREASSAERKKISAAE